MRSSSAPRTTLVVLAVLASSSVATVASPAAAQLAPGSTLVFTGTADATDLGSPGVLLDFAKHIQADPSANTGAFAPLNNNGRGASGSIENLTVGAGPQPIHNVVTIGGFKFDLAYVPNGRYGQDECYVLPAPGQRCTPYQLPSYELSPFYLENVVGSDGMFTALVSFDVTGSVTGRGTTTDFFGTITATFAGLSFQEALSGLEQHGLEDVPFTATFVVGAPATTVGAATFAVTAASVTAVTPEPSTVALVALGLAGMAGVARRRATRASGG